MRVLIVVLLAAVVVADVIGVDYGSEFVKVTSPHDQALDIVLNEQTRRKSFNFVGFRGDERFIGEDARNLAPRFPANMFSFTQHLLGVSSNSPQEEHFKNMLPTFSTVEDSVRSALNFSCPSNPAVEYSAEELSAMLLGYVKDIAAKDASIKPKDAVITVPAFWNQNQRRALLDAAKLVDLNVLSLMHSTTAAALQYGMLRRGFGNETFTLAIYDMGSSNSEVGIYQFSPTVVKEGEKLKLGFSLGTLRTIHIESDETLGGRAFDTCLARMIDDKAVSTLKISSVFAREANTANRKSLFSLLRAANGAKETLSANAQTPVTVEGIAPDRDYSTEIRRESFESSCQQLFARAVDLADRAVRHANLTFAAVDSFEVIGGGLRIPKIINDLTTLVGRTVNRTINGDESCAFGAGYYAMRRSGQYIVRSFAVEDRLPENYTFSVIDRAGKNSHRRTLFSNAILGSRKSITLNRTEDFSIEIYRGSELPAMTIDVSGVRAALDELGYFAPQIVHDNNSHSIRMELNLTEAGTIEISEVTARVRLAVEKSVKGESAVQMKTKSHSLAYETRFTGVQPLTQAQIESSRTTLGALLKIERLRRATATSKNNLETFMQHIRFNVLEEALDAQLRRDLEKALLEVTEWYEDGEGSDDGCTKAQFDKKLSLLQEIVNSAKKPSSKKQDAPKSESKAKSKKGKSKKTTSNDDVEL